MPRANFRVTADRLRRIADTLTESADREVTLKYADELDALARAEVVAPEPRRLGRDRRAPRATEIASIFKKAFPIEPGTPFGSLLVGLEKAERQPA